MTVFKGKKSSNHVMINVTMSDDDIPPRYLFDVTTHPHFYDGLCLFMLWFYPFVRHHFKNSEKIRYES